MLRYAITDGGTTLRDLAPLSERCSRLARDGIDFILVREKHLAAAELATLCKRIVAAVKPDGSATRVLVAQRVDVAIAVGLDGVHLSARPGGLTPPNVRSLMPQAFISVSCHTLDEVARARDDGASAVLFGPVYGKTVNGIEVAAGVGLQKLREACLAARTTPVLALGGLTGAGAAACMDAGAAGIAGIRLFFPE